MTRKYYEATFEVQTLRNGDTVKTSLPFPGTFGKVSDFHKVTKVTGLVAFVFDVTLPDKSIHHVEMFGTQHIVLRRPL